MDNDRLNYQEAKQYFQETIPFAEARKLAIERLYHRTGGNRRLSIAEVERLRLQVLAAFERATT